ncbi:hypothetical protein ACFRMQ_00070 [Kitasatospora sp. NPDC056783]|uniref:hypothetical protein n=1 Tax=Kitasatospora sp. NPDC056783 TaxID=3345943 RepID=UPI00368C6DA5
MPLSLVFASCPPAQVAPLLAALADHGYERFCPEHLNNPDIRCLPLGLDGTDAELYEWEIHDLYAALRRAAPQAGFAVVGGASEEGPGVLRMNHPRLGDFPANVPSENHRLSPLFTTPQITAMLARSANHPDAALRLHVALGQPWSRQFESITPGCLVAAPGWRAATPEDPQ